MSFAPRFTVTNAVTTALTRIERARGFLDAAKLSEDWIRRMGERALVLEAHHTTHIKGTRWTLEPSERRLAGGAVPEADPADARELLNDRRAFGFVSSSLNEGRSITEGLIREIHRRLVEGVRGGAAAPGEYRRVQNSVVSSATGEVATPRRRPTMCRPSCASWSSGCMSRQTCTPSLRAASVSSGSFPSTRSSTAMAAPRACSRRSASTVRATTSSAFSRSVSSATATAGLSTGRSGAYAGATGI